MLDDELPPLSRNNALYMSGRISKTMVDAVPSNQQASCNSQGLVQKGVSGYTPLPKMLGEEASAHVLALTDGVVTLAHNAVPLNMQLLNTIMPQRMMVNVCVKTRLFSRLKFFKKDVHGLLDLQNGTVCSMIVANCNVQPDKVDHHWWADMRKLVVSAHTHRRNKQRHQK